MKLKFRRKEEKIKEYMDDHPEIEKFIESTKADLSKYFDDPDIEMDMYEYDDVEYYFEIVAMIIYRNGDVDEAYKRFDKFMDKWLDLQYDTVGDVFNFNIELIEDDG